MKCSIVIAVLESYTVVRRQLLHFGKVFSKDEIRESAELILVDDGSSPSIVECLTPMLSVKETSTYDGMPLHKVNMGFDFRVLETKDDTPWSQPRARNKGAQIAQGEYLLMTDIDHILTKECIWDTINFLGDKLVFPRKYAILNEKGEIERTPEFLKEYGCKESDFEAVGSHANTFAMKTKIFNELLNGYDEKFCGKHGGDDTDLNRRYGELHYAGKVKRHDSGSMIYVFPDPSRDIKAIFHHLRRK